MKWLNQQDWVVAGSDLSPFTLKLLAMCRFSGLPVRYLPPEGGRLDIAKVLARLELIKRHRLPISYPPLSPLDELPLVPFLLGPDGDNLFDSSAIALWLDRQPGQTRMLLPSTQPAIHFLVQLIDEFADEFMLYMAHHNRWKVSALDNTAGARLADELSPILGPAKGWYADWFAKRQARRLPYLFSVAPEGFHIPGLAASLQPPAFAQAPTTHEFLETSFGRVLDALSQALASQPFLFGDWPTLADYSIYGQLAINLDDPAALTRMETLAPAVVAWLRQIRTVPFKPPTTAPEYRLTPALKPLLQVICDLLVPLLQQNEEAYILWLKQGETQFNEQAFWQRKALYRGFISDTAFTHVAKTFQVKTWRTLQQAWRRLSEGEQAEVETWLPANHGLHHSLPQTDVVSLIDH